MNLDALGRRLAVGPPQSKMPSCKVLSRPRERVDEITERLSRKSTDSHKESRILLLMLDEAPLHPHSHPRKGTAVVMMKDGEVVTNL